MAIDQNLVEAIKRNFANKSTSRLRTIVQSADQPQWSPEAIAAAQEMLLDRTEGRAQEPENPVDLDPPPPRDTYTGLGIWSSPGGPGGFSW